mgnify:CR=1 FL=1
MKKNNKGFTLIELLVVVAIIGILAAVGVVAYSGYTSGAKKQAAKSTHANVVKYISAELQKCNLGETSAMGGKLTCSGKTPTSVVNAAIASDGPFADFKNPYVNINHPYSAVVENPSTCQGAELGYVCLIVSDTNIKIKCCRTSCIRQFTG